jgi:hypothetical protein
VDEKRVRELNIGLAREMGFTVINPRESEVVHEALLRTDGTS